MTDLYEINGNTALQHDDNAFTCIEMHPSSSPSKRISLRDLLILLDNELATGTARGTSSRILSVSDKVLAGVLGAASMVILCLCMIVPKLLA